MRKFLRGSTLLLTSSLLGLLVSYAEGHAQGTEPVFEFDIPAENLDQALTDFSQVSARQIIFQQASVRGIRSPQIHGRYTAPKALELLLAATDLKEKTDAAGVFIIQPKNAEAASDGAAESKGVETIVVTAEKRSESSLDVPMALTAISGEQLERTQSYRFEDYVGKIPGLMLLEGGGGGSELVIRGLTTGAGDVNSSVAIYVDETPYQPSSAFALAILSAPDLDTFDMQRIEVLKGPQGTLYGANALGGLLKYVTNAPDTSGFSARVEAGVSSVDNGGLGFDYHAMVNVPLSDDLALRVVGYDNYYPGYIDDPSRGGKDINGAHYAGGRASLLYQPTSDFSVRLNVFYQDRQTSDYGNGSEDVNPGSLTPIHGDLTQERLISQPANATMELYNVTVDWNLGFAKLISTSSYTHSQFNLLADDSGEYEPFTPLILGSAYGIAAPLNLAFHSFVQEARLSSEDDGPLHWQVGGYFTDQSSSYMGSLIPIDLATKTVLYGFPLALANFNEPATYREYAGFANVDYYILPTLDVALGGRYSENDQTYTAHDNGLLTGTFNRFAKSSEGVFTYSGDARWHITPSNMLYARIAEGYIPGGPNDALPGDPLPPAYNSSTTINYEVGTKNSFLDDHLTVELSAFDIDWHDIQLSVSQGGFSGIENVGTAHSDGFEWNFRYVPLDGLTLGFNGAYTNAHITDYQGTKVGLGLPFVPYWQSSASADYEQPLFGDYSGFAGIDWRFTGGRDANFSSGQVLPSFAIFDLRAGIEDQRWSAVFYVKNIGNVTAINNLNPITAAGYAGPESAAIYPPRTIGFAVTANF